MTGRFGAGIDGQDNPGLRGGVQNDQTGRRLLEQIDGPGAPTDATTAAQSIHAQQQQFFGLLHTASDNVHSDWNTAKTGYDQAFQNAQQIDQNQVALLRRAVDQQLQTEQDPDKRRILTQEKMDLEALARATGFAKACKGLAEKRLGLDAAGTRDLMQAATLDPLMNDDPCFQRHLKDAETEEARVTGRQDSSIQDLPNGSDGSGRQTAGNVTDTGNGRTTGTVTDTGNGTTNTTTTTDANLTDLMTRRSVNDASGQPIALPQEWSQYSAVQQAEYLKSKCPPGTALSDDEKKVFTEIIYRADTNPSTRADQLINGPDGLTAVVNAENTALGQAGQTKLATLSTAAKNELATITDPQKNALARSVINQYLSAWKDEQITAFRQQLDAIDPKLGDLLGQQDQVIKDAGVWTQYLGGHNLKRQIANEANQSSIARATYADALAVDGNASDKTEAQTWIKSALQHNTNPDHAALLKAIALHDIGMAEADVRALPDTGTAPTATDTQNETGIKPVVATTDNGTNGGAGATLPAGLNPETLAAAVRATNAKFDAAPDKPTALTQLKTEFETNNRNADAMLSGTMDLAAQHITTLQAQIDAKVPPAQMATLRQNVLTAMTDFNAKADATDKQNFATYKNTDAPPADQATAKAALQAKYPDLVTAFEASRSATAPVASLISAQAADLNIVHLAQTMDFATHESYAKALSDAGSTDAAKAELTRAFQAMPVQDRTSLLADPKNGKPIQDLVTKLQFDVSSVPAPTIAPALASAIDKANGGTGAVTGAGRDSTGGAGSDANAGAIGALSPEVTGIKSDAATLKASWQAAVADLAQTKNFAQSKQKFEDAMHQADALLTRPAYSTDHINQLVNDLKSGKTTDATTHQQRDLTPDEIVNMNLEAVAAITARASVQNYHRQYADLLVQNKQWADATTQFKAMTAIADSFPVAQAKQEVANLQAASTNPALPPAAKDSATGLPSYINDLNQTMGLQPAVYLSAASFMVGGGKDLQSHVVNPECPVLDPAASKAYVDKAAAMQNQINGGTAGSKDDATNQQKFRDQIAVATELVRTNAKGALLADIERSDGIWKKPVGAFAMGATGVAVSIGLLAITHGESAKLLGGLAESDTVWVKSSAEWAIRNGDKLAANIDRTGKFAPYLRAGVVVVPGAVTASGGNVLLQRALGTNQPGSDMDAAIRGLGSYTATGSLLLTKEGLGNKFFGGITEDNIAENARRILSENGARTDIKLSELRDAFSKRNYGLPKELREKLANDENAILTDEDLRKAFGGNQRGIQLFNSVFKDQIREAEASLKAGDVNPRYVPPTGLPSINRAKWQNFLTGYGSLSAYSAINTLTDGAADSYADGKNHMLDDIKATYLPGAKQDGESTFHYVVTNAMGNPLIGDALFASLFAMPKAPPASDWNSWKELWEKPGQGWRANPTSGPLRGAAPLLNRGLDVAERSARVVQYPLARAGNWLNPRGTYAELTPFEQMRQGVYLPILAGEGYNLTGDGVGWYADKGRRLTDQSLLQKLNTPVTNGEIPTDGGHTDVGPPQQKPKPGTTADNQTGNGVDNGSQIARTDNGNQTGNVTTGGSQTGNGTDGGDSL